VYRLDEHIGLLALVDDNFRFGGQSLATVKSGPSINALPLSSRFAISLREIPRNIAGSQPALRCEKPT
jgi:hypothetical protein